MHVTSRHARASAFAPATHHSPFLQVEGRAVRVLSCHARASAFASATHHSLTTGRVMRCACALTPCTCLRFRSCYSSLPFYRSGDVPCMRSHAMHAPPLSLLLLVTPFSTGRVTPRACALTPCTRLRFRSRYSSLPFYRSSDAPCMCSHAVHAPPLSLSLLLTPFLQVE